MPFDRIKKDMLEDLKSARSGMNWAHTMLKAASRCKSEEEEKQFWNFICNPGDVENVPSVKLGNVQHPKEDDIPESNLFKIKEKIEDDEKEGEVEHEIEYKNTVHKNGCISHILVEPLPLCVD